MASQIAHIVYAIKYLEKYPSTINRDEFILGAVFPDIRRIDPNISRKDTHLKFEPIDLDFSGLTAFQAGWKFHLYCDMRREELLNQKNFYSIIDTAKFEGGSAKLLEDELLYDKNNNWEKLASYFNNIPHVETGLTLTPEAISLWYAMLAKYIEKKPDAKSMHIFLSKLNYAGGTADDILAAIQKLSKNQKAVEILQTIEENIV